MNFNRIKEHSADNLGSGTDPAQIEKLEEAWSIQLPEDFKQFLLAVGYAEIYGDEIYSIYEVPDEIPCLGLHWMNRNNEKLRRGFIQFFSNDIDGTFYIHNATGKVYLNHVDFEFANSFSEFIDKLLDD